MSTPKYHHALPQFGDVRLLTDSGFKATMIFHEGVELPYFASFDMLRSREGYAKARAYFDRHAEIAASRGFGFIADTPTWRASRDWGQSSATRRPRSTR
jgi:homocysteine S-methyltransferase